MSIQNLAPLHHTIPDQMIHRSLLNNTWGLSFACTTETVLNMSNVHQLTPEATIALGKTATVMALLTQYHAHSPASLQIQSTGLFKQLFADIEPIIYPDSPEKSCGNIRATIQYNSDSPEQRSAHLITTTDSSSKQRLLTSQEPYSYIPTGHFIKRGTFSLIRFNHETKQFQQSSTPLIKSEVDLDAEHFLQNSDQIDAIVRAFVILDEHQRVNAAGGLLLHRLPDGDQSIQNKLSTHLNNTLLTAINQRQFTSSDELLENLFHTFGYQTKTPSQTSDDSANNTRLRDIKLKWQCRCSEDKVSRALLMLGPESLADMVDKKEEAKVDCDFCNKQYILGPEQVEDIFINSMVGKGNN